MNYILMPSLEHIALLKIVITLWNRDYIQDLVSQFYFTPLIISETRKEWKKIEDKVSEKIQELPLPKLLKKQLPNFVEAIGWQILTWKKCYRNLLGESYVTIYLRKLCWTLQGTVDKKKTVEILIKDESLHICKRYMLACTFCLEDYIYILWEQLKEPYKKDLTYIRKYEPPFVSFWCHYIQGKLAQLDKIMKTYCKDDNVSSYEYAFQHSAVSGNEAATRYFLQKLTPEEKEKNFVKTAGHVAKLRCGCFTKHSDFPKRYFTDVLCFLLSVMNKRQQIEVSKNCAYIVLKCLLDWPWQNLFMKISENLWIFLSEEDYYHLLSIIIYIKVIPGHRDHNYQKLFGMFWKQSPDTHKKYVIAKCASSTILLKDLFKIEDKENIKLIFDNATIAEREKLVFCEMGQRTCQNLIYGDKWDLLGFFIQECISSKEVMTRFKKVFEQHITRCCSKEQFTSMKNKLDKFYLNY